MGEVEADRCSRLFAEGLERVLERRDLLLAPGRALGEVHARVETGRLELVEILQRRVELLLRALEVLPRVLSLQFSSSRVINPTQNTTPCFIPGLQIWICSTLKFEVI